MAKFGEITVEGRKKAMDAKKRATSLKSKYRIPTAMKAIRAKCLDCGVGSSSDAKLCHIPECPIWPYRFGRNPKEDDMKVPIFGAVSGEVEKWVDFDEYF